MPKSRVALLVRRDAPASRAAVAHLARERGPVVAVFDVEGARGLAAVVTEAHALAYDVLVIPALSDLGPTPLAALGVAEALCALSIAVVSVEEPWLAEGLGTAALVARWLAAANKRARVAKAKATLAANGRAPGRPRRSVPLADAERLVSQGMPVAAVARALAIPETTLRRALQQKRLADRLVALTVSLTTEAK